MHHSYNVHCVSGLWDEGCHLPRDLKLKVQLEHICLLCQLDLLMLQVLITHCCSQVPSYGILTNGQNMQFYKYYTNAKGEKVLLESDMFPVFISADSTWQDARKAAQHWWQVGAHFACTDQGIQSL